MSNRRSFGPLIGGVLLLALGLGLAFWGISTRATSLDVVTKETRELAVPTVAVIAPERGAPQQEIVLPGTMQAFTDAGIYARVPGYLRKWYVDLGAHVRAGQVMADIDTPEIDQQLAQARADLATAEANTRLAQLTAERYRDLIKTDSVSKQDLDNANGSLEAKATAVTSATRARRCCSWACRSRRTTASATEKILRRCTSVLPRGRARRWCRSC